MDAHLLQIAGNGLRYLIGVHVTVVAGIDAEIEAIGEACRRLGGWRLWECTLYVTLEPCPMCAGAIINARIPRVVYGASDRKCGAVDSVCSLFSMEFNHHPQVESGVREAECGALLTEFFRNLRMELRSRPRWKPGSNT